MRNLLFWGVWHALAGLAVALFPLLLFSDLVLWPIWVAPRDEIIRLVVLILGYPLGALALQIRSRMGGEPSFGTGIALALAGFVPPLLYLTANGTDLATGHIVGTVALGVLLLPLPLIVRIPDWHLNAGFSVVIAAGALVLALTTDSFRGLRQPPVEFESVATNLYSLQMASYRGHVPRTFSGRAGGGITDLGDGGLLVTGDGDMYRYGWDDAEIQIEPIALGTPMNRASLIEDVGPSASFAYFRVTDVTSRSYDGGLQIFLSHHFWRREEACAVLRVSMLNVDGPDALATIGPEAWKTLFETEPCVELQTETDAGWPFRGMEGGGKMEFLDPGRMLLTVGDHGFNGVDFALDLVNAPTAAYGKTLLVDLEDGSWEVFSVGHRNAQGLAVLADGSVLQSEHGPKGGDELNLLEQGVHYGWPTVTYGTDYDQTAWPLSPDQGRHPGYRQPLFAWVPSIGASAIAAIESPLFSLWRGDVLVSSLVPGTLFRARLSDGHVRFVEPIPVGEPIRDLHFDGRGRIVLWTDLYSFVVVTPSASEYGACAGCHRIEDGQRHAIGPDLAGVIGRPVAGAPGFDYSDALRSVGGGWSEERLDRFLADPQGFAPGNTMLVDGIDDPAIRRAVIDHLLRGGG